MRQNILLESIKQKGKNDREITSLKSYFSFLCKVLPRCLPASTVFLYSVTEPETAYQFDDDFQRRYQGALEERKWRSPGTMLNDFWTECQKRELN